MLLLDDDPKTAGIPDPQALIEEARQLQRQRARRRNMLIQATALLVILGFGVSHFAQGDSSAPPTPPRSLGGTTPTQTVTYQKIVEQWIVPHLPAESRTIETWYSRGSGREVITLPGGRRVEIGHMRVRDKVLGPELINYLYDSSTNTIYRAGLWLGPAPAPSPEQLFEPRILVSKKKILGAPSGAGQILGAPPGARLAGTRIYKGRPVYIVKSVDPAVGTTTYVDKRTYQVLLGVGVSTDLRAVQRGLVYRILPATRANLALTSLSATHPKARTVQQAPPRIKKLYGDATRF